MRMIALAAVALALSACGSGDSGTSADEANALATDNLMMDENLMLDADEPMNGMGGMDANASTNGATENLMQKDAATNDPDTNLANGL
ncbi:MAG: hypothetical protein ACXW27_11435 [Allosphingosinicella sp.]